MTRSQNDYHLELEQRFHDQGGIGFVMVNNELNFFEGFSIHWMTVLDSNNVQQNKLAEDGHKRPARLINNRGEWDRIMEKAHAAGYREVRDPDGVQRIKVSKAEDLGVILEQKYHDIEAGDINTQYDVEKAPAKTPKKASKKK